MRKFLLMLGLTALSSPLRHWKLLCGWSQLRMSRLAILLAMTIFLIAPSFAQTVFNCPSFNGNISGACSVDAAGYNNPDFLVRGGGNLSGSVINMIPANSGHNGYSVNYFTTVNIQAFTTTFTFIPNGQNLALVVQNGTNQPGYDGNIFDSGAGCEGGFFQGSIQPPVLLSPNNTFALEVYDSQEWLTYANSVTGFTYSSTQLYQSNIVPCLPNQNQAVPYFSTNKISTTPVSFNSPANTGQTTTGNTYKATITYTGTHLNYSVYNVTAGGSCPGSSCFSYTWPVSIPPIAGGTTAYVGLTGGINIANLPALHLNSWSYIELSPAATPAFSPSAGDYGSTQSVAISDSSSGSIICYNTTGNPATNGTTGCATGTLYSGAILVPAGTTIYAVAGGTGFGDSAIGSAAYQIGSTASQPTFYPASELYYSGDPAVTLTAAQGSVICYNTTGSPATNGTTGCTTGTRYTAPFIVSSNETVYAVAGGTGFTDSPVGSVSYTLNPFWDGSSPAGQAPANMPTFSPLPGTYSGTQSVTLSTVTTGSTTPYICYTAASSPPALTPQTDNMGGCAQGTLYTGPISVSSSQTIYAMAGTKYASLPSTPVQ